MAANVETMAYAGATPWHGYGTRVEPNLTGDEMVAEAGLNWTVEKTALFTGPEKSLIVPTHFALTRNRGGVKDVLGIAGSDYKVSQNIDVVKFADKFVKAGDMKMHTAGALDDGRRVWFLAELKKGFTLPGGDEVEGFLLISHPHIWGEAMRIVFTTVRVVCQNTLRMALGQAGGFRMTHSYEFDETMMELAEETLGLATSRFETFQSKAELLAKTHITERQSQEFIIQLLTPNVTLPANDDEAIVDLINRTGNKILHSYRTAPGQDMASANDTLWGLVNGVTHFVDHVAGRSRDSGLTSAWFGMNGKLKDQAFDQAVRWAQAA
jgi:phage/plasmid-like protein (TIGR03299 family)